MNSNKYSLYENVNDFSDKFLIKIGGPSKWTQEVISNVDENGLIAFLPWKNQVYVDGVYYGIEPSQIAQIEQYALEAKTVLKLANEANHLRLSSVTNETTGATTYTLGENDIASAQELRDVSNLVNTLVDNDSNKSVRDIAMDVLVEQLIPESASESFDTLKEIAEWIQSHPSDAYQMNVSISWLNDTIENLLGGAAATEEYGTNPYSIPDKILDYINTYVGTSYYSVTDPTTLETTIVPIETVINEEIAKIYGPNFSTETTVYKTIADISDKLENASTASNVEDNAERNKIVNIVSGDETKLDVTIDTEKREVKITPLITKVSQLENDLNFQTDTQVQEAIDERFYWSEVL